MRDPRHPLWPDAGERTELRDVAERWKWRYVDWCHDAHRARVLGTPKARPLGRMIEEYLEHRQARVSRQTLRNDRAALAHLKDDFGEYHPVETINPQRTLDRLLGKLRRSTVRTYSRFLSSFFGWLAVPYEVRLPKEQERRAVCWTDEQVEDIRDAAGDLLLPLDCGLFMGLRLREIWGLEWDDVGDSVVRVQRQWPDEPLKSRRERTAVVLPGWEHRTGKGRVVDMPYDHRQRRLADVLEGLGLKVPGSLWHAARHTYARRFLEAEPNMRLLQASLGHASIRTTETLYNWLLPDPAAEIARARIHGR